MKAAETCKTLQLDNFKFIKNQTTLRYPSLDSSIGSALAGTREVQNSNPDKGKKIFNDNK